MFERFTDPGRQVLVLAQREAVALQHQWIGTEHVLLGLLRQEEGIAIVALHSLGIEYDVALAEVILEVGKGDAPITPGQIPLTPRTKKVMELALREALSLGHNYIGPEHVLVGITRENEGVASDVLSTLGADAETIRDAVMQLIFERGTGREMAAKKRVRPKRTSLQPISDSLRAQLDRTLDSLDQAKTIAKSENDTRRMAIIVHTERLLAKLIEPHAGSEPPTSE